jgi:hypothetical protein
VHVREPIRGAHSDKLLGRIDEEVQYVRLTSDEPVIFSVYPNPGSSFDPGAPRDYKLQLIRVRKGSEFELPGTL